MAVKPTTNPTDWATDTSGVALKIETSDYHKQYGWGIISGVPEVPNLNEVNYWRFSVHQWLQYLDLSGEERDVDIATVNSRIDNLSSDQVSYEYSNDDVGNIFSVPLTTFIEFDGTTSTQYTDDGTLTTIENTTNAKNTGVLSLANPNNTNDTLASSLSNASVYPNVVTPGEESDVSSLLKLGPISCAPKLSGDVNERFRKRFKYSLEQNSSGTWSLRISKYNTDTGNFDAPSVVWSGSKDTKKYTNNVVTTDDHVGFVFIGDGSLSSTYYYVFYDVRTETIIEGQVPGYTYVDSSGDDFVFERQAYTYRGQGWIIYPEIGGVVKPTFLFITNRTFQNFSGVPDVRMVSMVNSDGHKWLLFPNLDSLSGEVISHVPWFYGTPGPVNIPATRMEENGMYFYLDPADNTKLRYSSVNTRGRTDTNIHITNTADWCNLDTAEPKFNKVDLGDVGNARGDAYVYNSEGSITLPGFPELLESQSQILDNCIRTVWSDFNSEDTTGLTIVGLQALVDSSNTQVEGTYNCTVMIMADAPDTLSTNPEAKELLYSGNIYPPNIFATGVTQAVCGVGSIDLLKKSGNTYTFTLGFIQGGADVDSATEYTFCTDYTWDGTDFVEVAGSTVTSSALTDDEKSKWKLDTDTENFSNLCARVSNSAGVKKIDFQGFQEGQAPMYQAEVYQDGYFVYFRTNEALIYGTGNTPPSKPSWGGTARAAYFGNTPSAGQNTLFTSSLNNTITGTLNGLSTGLPITPQGILDMVDGQTYGYTMCSFYPAASAPSGLSVQFTSVDFLQYDAFIPGLGNVQAALDSLYSQIGTITRMEAFGGTEVNTTFDNHVLSLVTPKRYTDTGVSLTSGVATTITHNLNQQIVQIAVYDESNDQKVDVDVTLVDANSLTITSSSTITVSVVVLK